MLTHNFAALYVQRRVFTGVALVILLIGLAGSSVAAVAQREQPRPTLSGPVETVETDHFIIHYTREGADAVPLADADSDSVPDWAADAAAVMEEVWAAQIDQMGWPPPPPDEGEGGDTRYDVYFMDIQEAEDASGYSDDSNGSVGDNPLTGTIEQYAAYTFIVLDNDMAEEETDLAPAETLRLLAAHEFNHALQSGLDTSNEHGWLYEATATWMEGYLYPDLSQNADTALGVFKSPDTCIVAEGGTERIEDELHQYAMWIFLQALSDRYGPEIVLEIWQEAVTSDGFTPVETALVLHRDSLDAAFTRFARQLLLRDFSDGDSLPTVRLQASLVPGDGYESGDDGVQPLAADYFALEGEGVVSVEVESDAPLNLVGIGISQGTADVLTPLEQGAPLVLDLSLYEYSYLIVLNLDRPANEVSCDAVWFSLRVTPASETALTPAGLTVNAPNFEPPQVEAVTPAEEGEADEGEEGEALDIETALADLDVAFEPLPPFSGQFGFEVVDIFSLTAEAMADEYGDDAVPFTMPDGNQAVEYDYENSESQSVYITQSQTSYATLNDWLEDIGYTLEEPFDQWDVVGDVEVLVSDLSDKYGAYYSVTLIYDGLFIVVEGESEPDVLLALAADLIG